MQEVRSACERVAQISRSVKIDAERLEQRCAYWKEQPFEVPGWNWEVHWRGDERETVHYVLLLDALNFCFWADPGQPRWRVFEQGRWWNGYKGLAVALGRALREGIPLTDAHFLADLDLAKMAHILRGEVEIPLLPKRLEHAREVGQVLLQHFQGDFRNAIAGSAADLARLIGERFPCFHDVSEYAGEKVPLYKRAQITVVDLAGSLEFQGLGRFPDLGQLTAFADYKIPQMLRAQGILVYTPELAERVDNYVELAPGCPEEVEIRALMVWAVELIGQKLGLHPYQVDWFLWNLGQSPVEGEKPYHRVRTVFY